MVIESIVGGSVIGGFNKARSEVDLKINWSSGVTNCDENCNKLQWHDLSQFATKAYYKTAEICEKALLFDFFVCSEQEWVIKSHF